MRCIAILQHTLNLISITKNRKQLSGGKDKLSS